MRAILHTDPSSLLRAIYPIYGRFSQSYNWCAKERVDKILRERHEAIITWAVELIGRARESLTVSEDYGGEDWGVFSTRRNKNPSGHDRGGSVCPVSNDRTRSIVSG